MKTPWRDGATPVVMLVLKVTERLAGLVWRPHLIRFHGELAPNGRLRAMLVPDGPEEVAGVSKQTATVGFRTPKWSGWAAALGSVVLVRRRQELPVASAWTA